ncbi:MAG: PAS domain S-box protein [Pseudomonadota bacterium]
MPIFFESALLVLSGALALALVNVAVALWRQRIKVREAEAALASNDAKLRAILDHAPAEIYLKDEEGRYLLINRQFERLFGVRNRDLIGKLPGDVHEGDLAELSRAQDLEVLETGKTIAREENVKTRLGDKVFHTIKFPLRDDSGRIIGLGAVSTDITELAEAREQAIRLEQRLTDAVNALPAGFVYFEPSGQIGLINTRYQDLLAQLGHPPDTKATFEQLLRTVLAKGRIPEAEGQEEDWIQERLAVPSRAGEELEYQMPDGRWYKAFDERTSDGGVVGVRVDISMLKRQQESLSAAISERDAAEKRFSDIAEINSGWFWEQDKDLRFTYISDVFEQKTGYLIAARLGQTREEAIDDDAEILAGSDWDWLNRKLEAREPFENFVYGIRGEDGELIWVRISGAPFFDADGEFAGYRGVGSDVTDLYTAITSAEAANRAKSDFLANISHEIRTPLTAVLGMAEELERRVGGEEERKFARTIRESGEHLLEIINDVLDFSKIEARRVELEHVPFKPADLVDRIVTLHSMKAAEKGLSFSAELEEGIPEVRVGDPQRILQVLHNLVGNAIKFTLSGGVVVSLADAGGDRMKISVADSGIGMTRDQLGRVFDGFSQADTSIARRFGGTGLGMSITKKLVDAMDGSLDIQSTPDEGTSVHVILPLPASDATVEAAPKRPAIVAEKAIPRGLRILAVDDNETNRTLIGLLLQRIGAEATIVDSGPAAISAAEKHAYDLIMMDIAMPSMDGIEALNRLRAAASRAGFAEAPALAVTANALTYQIEAYLEMGFQGHVAKPIQMADLFEEIRRVSLASKGEIEKPTAEVSQIEDRTSRRRLA